MCFVPAPFPGPVQDCESHLLQLRVPVPVFGLFEDEPSSLDGMARIDGPAWNRIDEFAVRPDCFQNGFKLRLHEIAMQFGYRLVDLACQHRVVYRFPDAGGGVDQDHAKGMPFCYESFSEFGL